MSQAPTPANDSSNRRSFLKNSSLIVATGAVVGGSLNFARAAHAYGDDTIKIGLIGCGGRGHGAAENALNTAGSVKLVAVGDAFGDRMQACLRGLGRFGQKLDVPKERQFVGFDAYAKVLEADVDMVILATPPGFRPLHFSAAVAAGKHVFMEKPVATDAPGVRQVLAAATQAKEKNLAVGVGLQRRHEGAYIKTIDSIQNGSIGDIILARSYWNGSTPWVRPRQAGQTELEYQMRNWYYFNWLCGDHICEQHIHNLDVINWVMNGYPETAQGQGGCQVRNGKDHGETFDHHFIEFRYKGGAYNYSQCRHIEGCWNSVAEQVHGTKGYADVSGGKIYSSDGKMVADFSRAGGGGHQQEHHDLFAELRKGNRPNEGEYGALSSMTAIFGRMATYSGKMLKWNEALNCNRTEADFASYKTMQDEAPVKPNEAGVYQRAKPGSTDPYKPRPTA